MKYCKRLQQYFEKDFEETFEEILMEEEFLTNEGKIVECYFCNETDFIEIKEEYSKLKNEEKMKVKELTHDIKYHEQIKLTICDQCGKLLMINRKNGEKIFAEKMQKKF